MLKLVIGTLRRPRNLELPRSVFIGLLTLNYYSICYEIAITS
jgi:hypothetical protein